jgi:NADH:ubiquinone oxidoreductase subunit 6 (subunit J)
MKKLYDAYGVSRSNHVHSSHCMLSLFLLQATLEFTFAFSFLALAGQVGLASLFGPTQ